jgi:hypothetical protein
VLKAEKPSAREQKAAEAEAKLVAWREQAKLAEVGVGGDVADIGRHVERPPPQLEEDHRRQIVLERRKLRSETGRARCPTQHCTFE